MAYEYIDILLVLILVLATKCDS